MVSHVLCFFPQPPLVVDTEKAMEGISFEKKQQNLLDQDSNLPPSPSGLILTLLGGQGRELLCGGEAVVAVSPGERMLSILQLFSAKDDTEQTSHIAAAYDLETAYGFLWQEVTIIVCFETCGGIIWILMYKRVYFSRKTL